MSKRPSDDFLIAKLEQAEAIIKVIGRDIARMKELLPLVRQHRLRDLIPPATSMECTRPDVILKVHEPDPEPKDRQAILYVLDTLNRLSIARRMLAERLPALDAALDGRKLEDEAPLGSRPVVEGQCIACGEVVARLKRGMCATSCYQAWKRAGGPDVGMWIPARRQYLEEKLLGSA